MTSDGRDVLAPIFLELGSGAKIKYARASVCEPRLNKAGGEAHTGLINKKAFPNCTQRLSEESESVFYIFHHSALKVNVWNLITKTTTSNSDES